MDTAHSHLQFIWCCTRISANTTWISIANNLSGRLSTSSFYLCLSKYEWRYWTAGIEKKFILCAQSLVETSAGYLQLNKRILYSEKSFDIIYLDKFIYLITIWRSNLTPKLTTYNNGTRIFVSFPLFSPRWPQNLSSLLLPDFDVWRLHHDNAVVVQCRKNNPWRIIVIYRRRHLPRNNFFRNVSPQFQNDAIAILLVNTRIYVIYKHHTKIEHVHIRTDDGLLYDSYNVSP